MDIIREANIRNGRRRRIAVWSSTLLIAALGLVGIVRMKPALPTVDRAVIWIDTVRRGTMIRQVQGPGTLVPEEIWWIPATTESRVERILVQPGTVVEAGSVILELSDPELEQAAIEAKYQLKAAEAELRNLRAELEGQRIEREAGLASIRSEREQATLQARIEQGLSQRNLGTEVDTKMSTTRAEEYQERYRLQERRTKIGVESARARIAVQQARIEGCRAALALLRHKVESLHVRAGIDGVLQQLPVQVGQRVTLGTTLAKVAQPSRLKAELKIPETQAKDVVVGQKVSIDTHNGFVPGRVGRIDPAVQGGTVTVDVLLEGELPRGARPDLSVEGTIEIEKLENVLHVGRPAAAGTGENLGIFRIDADGRGASRVEVRFGRNSVSTIEILHGLNAGERIILSDMAQWDATDQVEFE